MCATDTHGPRETKLPTVSVTQQECESRKGERVGNPLRTRLRIFVSALVTALVVALVSAAGALAFYEQYGFYSIGNNGYVQSAGAHTFTLNFGAGSNGGRLACQLF